MADDPKDQETPADQVSDDATGTSSESQPADEPETKTETPTTE